MGIAIDDDDIEEIIEVKGKMPVIKLKKKALEELKQFNKIKPIQKNKLLRLMTGYDQHTSPFELYSDHTSDIVSVLLSMKKEGYSDSTLRFASKALMFLNDNCNLNDPESVKNSYPSMIQLIATKGIFAMSTTIILN